MPRKEAILLLAILAPRKDCSRVELTNSVVEMQTSDPRGRGPEAEAEAGVRAEVGAEVDAEWVTVEVGVEGDLALGAQVRPGRGEMAKTIVDIAEVEAEAKVDVGLEIARDTIDAVARTLVVEMGDEMREGMIGCEGGLGQDLGLGRPCRGLVVLGHGRDHAHDPGIIGDDEERFLCLLL